MQAGESDSYQIVGASDSYSLSILINLTFLQ